MRARVSVCLFASWVSVFVYASTIDHYAWLWLYAYGQWCRLQYLLVDSTRSWTIDFQLYFEASIHLCDNSVPHIEKKGDTWDVRCLQHNVTHHHTPHRATLRMFMQLKYRSISKKSVRSATEWIRWTKTSLTHLFLISNVCDVSVCMWVFAFILVFDRPNILKWVLLAPVESDRWKIYIRNNVRKKFVHMRDKVCFIYSMCPCEKMYRFLRTEAEKSRTLYQM